MKADLTLKVLLAAILVALLLNGVPQFSGGLSMAQATPSTAYQYKTVWVPDGTLFGGSGKQDAGMASVYDLAAKGWRIAWVLDSRRVLGADHQWESGCQYIMEFRK
ncbi:MAG: hypothetical protein ABFE08_08755 [Armatimonadia bacterium]